MMPAFSSLVDLRCVALLYALALCGDGHSSFGSLIVLKKLPDYLFLYTHKIIGCKYSQEGVNKTL